jgi:para-nitrobenzyl esterase
MERHAINIISAIFLIVFITAACTGMNSATESERDAEERINNSGRSKAVFTKIESGEIMGFTHGGVNTFYGIPYGKAHRFEMAKPVDPWQGVRPCLMHGEIAPQNKVVMNRFDTHNYSTEGVENEKSCLVLNVHSPDMAPEMLKPVVFWIHGGGYSTGSSVEYTFYDGGNLAKYGDIVFVSANHRLNVLGYLDMSAYGDSFKHSANAGMSDLVLALAWVSDNIEKFGGDPDNVTIQGQSGGGGKVQTLMGMPAAKGLFHKAVIQSGGSRGEGKTTEMAQAETEKLAESLGLTGDDIARKLQTMPYGKLYDAYSQLKINPNPVVDGDYYPAGSFEMSKDIPLMCGTVLGEFSTNYGALILGNFESEEAWYQNNLSALSEEQVIANYKEKYGDKAEEVMAAFIEAYPAHKPAEGLYANNRRYGFFASGEKLAVTMNSIGGTAYLYVQAYNYPMFGGVVPVHTASGIPFWFHNIDKIPVWVEGDEKAAWQVSDEMAMALARFAHTGNPGQPGLKWEKFTPENGAIMVFDRQSALKYKHDEAFMELTAPQR